MSRLHRIKSESFAVLFWLVVLAVIATGPFLLVFTVMCFSGVPGACA